MYKNPRLPNDALEDLDYKCKPVDQKRNRPMSNNPLSAESNHLPILSLWPEETQVIKKPQRGQCTSGSLHCHTQCKIL